MNPQVKEAIKAGVREFLICAVFGAIIGGIFGYACGRAIDKDFAEHCDGCREDMTDFCHEYWEAKKLCGYPKAETKE